MLLKNYKRMKRYLIFSIITVMIMTTGCKHKEEVKDKENFQFLVEQFADIKILRYQVPGFEDLSVDQKKLIYYLSQAAVEGRDILFDQNYKYNLVIRKTLEAIYSDYKGDRTSDDFKKFEVYLKRVWFSNGIHHHYSADKIDPGFPVEYFNTLMKDVNEEKLPLEEGETKAGLIALLDSVLFNPDVDNKRVNQADGQDLILTSANNYYAGGITQKEVEDFYAAKKIPGDSQPVSYGLNSTLVKKDGKIYEDVWKVGGKYSVAIEKIVYWLEKALTVAENDKQKSIISLLISYYKTGDLKTFDEFNIAWLKDDQSRIDFVNGFTETYGDPLGFKGAWESLVNFVNLEATNRTKTISENAQWFENNSPVDPRFRKEVVKGVSAKVITAAMLAGDCYPATPIGINLPNADWIRKEHGSKSVTIENIVYSYDQAALGNGFLEEFCYSSEEIEAQKKYGFIGDVLHTDMHECLGHGSGQLLPDVSGDELKSYSAVIEEARADLFALYYMGDEKMIELGLLPDEAAYKAAYDDYIRNGIMTQLTRIEPGKNIEQSHMRNRQLISKWTYEKGAADKVIEKKVKDGKTYFVINDYAKLRGLFGQLLAEIQRIKSEGDFNGAKNMVENYAVKVDGELHKEVLARYKKLNIAPYSGFLNPVYETVTNDLGEIVDIKLDFSEGYIEQMQRYSKNHSVL